MMTHSLSIPTRSSVSALIRHASDALPGDDTRREAELLLEHVLGVNRAWLFMHADHVPADTENAAFAGLVRRRAQGEPLAYILGHCGFWTLDLKVTPATLIPRAETELLVEAALECLPTGEASRVADLGTGSGAIALSLASERPRCSVVATDASPEALAVARENARRHELHNVEFREGSWLAPLSGEHFHLLVSNPPYIAEGDAHLARGDLPHEPAIALSSGADGLDAIRIITSQAPSHLHPAGWLMIEHGYDQGAAVRNLFLAAGFVSVSSRRDLEQRERITLGRLSG